MSEIELRRVVANGIGINTAIAGRGEPVLLLHGFPHTWQLWRAIMPRLARTHRVIAPDLRGLGATERPADGYDAGTLASDAECLLDALGEPAASVVGIDAGAPPAFLLAMRRPERVRRLVVAESLLGRLPGAEDFLRAGPPWWFGFHAVPGLAETVLIGHEAEYVDWFLDTGTRARGVPPELRDRFVEAYRGHDALRAAFSHYRAMPDSAEQIGAAVASGRLTVPTMAIGAHPVGNALERQLRPIADDLVAHLVEDCGHLVPLDRPEVFGALLEDFLAGQRASAPMV
ncbi:alpha/beta fold hydrolase [Amycolatopsis sp. CA-230715]|uniref:alpha/beta fold hydrolase n=1 Tax=Amycolatopsis sp. CA-230715 TaxID=2745196 RepID=UPI001C02C1EB|nr:alpha/beta fold hydrolase [Amycolatopsis sp. CA-230715]QWF83273.1 Soluble epoxide hydrolase [Amycolatopsis sp. CA-230715]